jgi:hypothetical protein
MSDDMAGQHIFGLSAKSSTDILLGGGRKIELMAPLCRSPLSARGLTFPCPSKAGSTVSSTHIAVPPALPLLADEFGFDPIEDRLRANVRITMEARFEDELVAFLGGLCGGRCDTLRRKVIAADTASDRSTAPFGPRRCGCHVPGSRARATS